MQLFIGVISLIYLSGLSLAAYGNGDKSPKSAEIKENKILATGHINGAVQSEIVDTDTCQLYLGQPQTEIKISKKR
jgi:hypothetical protein